MGEVDRWSNIHQDLLKEITKPFHSYDNDYLQQRFVCKQWNLKLPKIPNGNKVPWLLLPIGGGGGAAKESFEEFHSREEEDIYHIMQLPTIDEQILDTGGLEEEGIYHLILPELQDNKICGSCHGWVIIVMVHEDSMCKEHPSDFASRHDLGIFNLEDGSFKRLLTDVNFFCSPVWVLS
ncbi:uncharacterized protein LOC110271233 [Arachis ipaensis]|uniref:uncharacterized protein LOC110271233 n=1 Tax=Arachis ipaensis TaxID=130454 RepID=UPI000A2B79FB|nr:uncharacterized protein LOC110271233 [Arachis ipaensis]